MYKIITKQTALCGLCIFMAYSATANAAVASRPSASAQSAPATSRMPTTTAKVSTAKTNSVDTYETTDTTTSVQVQSAIIENKESQFDTVFETLSSGNIDASTQNLANLIRAQRASLDAANAEEFSNKKTQTATAGLSACDSGLRSCMQEKCGSDFLKCATDGDTIWGDKMDACRRNVTCSGEEYRLFTIEIKADRDMNSRLSRYQAVLDCGNSYNACIEEQCGATFNKCLGKAAGDAAIAKCASIARDCTQQDSGLAGRAMNVFATLRQDAEKQVKQDEKKLYELRDKMRSRCQTLGALFDERSFDCVYSVEFWAGMPTASLYASKKAYAGSTFDCTQDWFGVDITTFKENAYRLTRAQTSATSALLGSGVGMAVGSITSGAINRAIDRKKAEDAVKKAEQEEVELRCGGITKEDECTGDCKWKDGKCGAASSSGKKSKSVCTPIKDKEECEKNDACKWVDSNVGTKLGLDKLGMTHHCQDKKDNADEEKSDDKKQKDNKKDKSKDKKKDNQKTDEKKNEIAKDTPQEKSDDGDGTPNMPGASKTAENFLGCNYENEQLCKAIKLCTWDKSENKCKPINASSGGGNTTSDTNDTTNIDELIARLKGQKIPDWCTEKICSSPNESIIRTYFDNVDITQINTFVDNCKSISGYVISSYNLQYGLQFDCMFDQQTYLPTYDSGSDTEIMKHQQFCEERFPSSYYHSWGKMDKIFFHCSISTKPKG